MRLGWEEVLCWLCAVNVGARWMFGKQIEKTVHYSMIYVSYTRLSFMHARRHIFHLATHFPPHTLNNYLSDKWFHLGLIRISLTNCRLLAMSNLDFWLNLDRWVHTRPQLLNRKRLLTAGHGHFFYIPSWLKAVDTICNCVK